ncbi:hypothetical protein [Chryseobacterium sp. R2A-55]|uniref:hypothetical protein n=1 Tax=Chryseobacterium sp. R2A-55 TaxID=2744445 RepID=UPI001F2425A4|nr:hypothetical protein [Chryseobacterium sp. R2A-55]
MKAGETRTLVKDNTFQKNQKRYFWGKKGEKVKIISISGNAVIYQNEKGKMFPCNIKDLE